MKNKRSLIIMSISLLGVLTAVSSAIIIFGSGRDKIAAGTDSPVVITNAAGTDSATATDDTADAGNTSIAGNTGNADNISLPDIETPESLLELKDKYPETAEFVDAYSKYYNSDFDIDLTDELTEGEIPLFIQWDKRWGYKTYGNDFFGVNGCGPTCLSMVVCGLTNDASWDPYSVALFSMDNDYYVKGQGTSWNLMTEGARNLGLTVESGRITQWYIEHNLSSESPMICSMEPGDFTYTGHFIVLTGIDEEGKIIVNDPNSYINSDKHWDILDLLPQIKSIWCYRR